MEIRDNSFGKGHRLCNKTLLETLFSQGRGFFAYPFRCAYLISDTLPGRKSEPVQIVITVSKRNHKHAVDRNLIKRRIREAYRLNKHLWTDDEGARILEKLGGGSIVAVGLIYTPKEILKFEQIENGVKKAIVALRKDIEKHFDISDRRAD